MTIGPAICKPTDFTNGMGYLGIYGKIPYNNENITVCFLFEI